MDARTPQTHFGALCYIFGREPFSLPILLNLRYPALDLVSHEVQLLQETIRTQASQTPAIWLVSAGAMPVQKEGRIMGMRQAYMLSLARSSRMEMGVGAVANVDFDFGDVSKSDIDATLHQLKKYQNVEGKVAGWDNEIVLRNNGWFVPTMFTSMKTKLPEKVL